MGLKYRVSSLTEVAEAVRSLYRQDGDAYVLDVEGAVPSTKLDEFRTNNIELQKQLEKLKGVDPTKYAELMELQRKVDEKKLIDAGDLEGAINLRVQAMKAEHEGVLNGLNGQLQSANRQLATLLIDNVVKAQAIAAGVLPTALEDVTLRANAVFSLKDGQPVLKDPQGNVVYGKDGTTPKSVNEWMTDLRKNAGHLFQGFNGGGAGGGTGGNRGPVDTSKMTPAQMINHALANNPGLLSDLPGA